MNIIDQKKKLENTLPKSLILTGFLLLVIGMFIIFTIAYLLEYSDKVVGNITLTTTEAPLNIVSKDEGTITLLMSNKESVKRDQVLGIIQNSANFKDILELETRLKNEQALGKDIVKLSNLKLGSVQPTFLRLQKGWRSYENFLKNQELSSQIAAKQKSITLYEERLEVLKNKANLASENVRLAEKQADSKARLAEQKTIAEAEFERALQQKIDRQSANLSNEEAINAIKIRIAELEEDINTVRREYKEERQDFEDKIQVELGALQIAVEDWKDQYLLVAPRNGQCIWNDELEDGYYTQIGQQIGVIVPNMNEARVGKIQITSDGAAKVKIGQEVNIFLADYPPKEFGILKGVVSRIAPLPENGLLRVEVELPENLVSTYGGKFDFRQLSSGRAEIITNKMSFAKRIWNEVRGRRLNS